MNQCFIAVLFFSIVQGFPHTAIAEPLRTERDAALKCRAEAAGDQTDILIKGSLVVFPKQDNSWWTSFIQNKSLELGEITYTFSVLAHDYGKDGAAHVLRVTAVDANENSNSSVSLIGHEPLKSPTVNIFNQEGKLILKLSCEIFAQL